MLKRLNSPWHSDDRSGVWLKLKPDYLEGRVDVDCVVLGGWYGEGRRGAGLSQYLMGLVAPKSAQCDGPIQFATFCRVSCKHLTSCE